MRWHIVAPATAAAGTGATALILGVVLDPTPRTQLLIIYLVTAAALGVITALIVWAVETVSDGLDAIRAEVRAGNAYEELMAGLRADPPSRPTHLRSVKPS